jgi:uncharacterized membrane protein YraQ (UPF0718 family)
MKQLLIEFIEVFRQTGATIIDLAPYIIIGVIIGEALKLMTWTKTVFLAIERYKFMSVILASIVGMLSPLCTFGTVPVMLQLYKSGVSLAPLVSFLSSSSMMNPQLFIYTMGSLGFEMAAQRALAVFAFGLIIGTIVKYIPIHLIINSRVQTDKETCTEILARENKRFLLKAFIKDCIKSLEFVGFNFLLAIFIGELINVFVPTLLLSEFFTPNKWYSVLLAGLAGIPFYVCGGGNIPLIGVLMERGLSKGAALAFFIVGPATRINSLMAISTLLKPIFIIFYIIILLIFSQIVGLILV